MKPGDPHFPKVDEEWLAAELQARIQKMNLPMSSVADVRQALAVALARIYPNLGPRKPADLAREFVADSPRRVTILTKGLAARLSELGMGAPQA